MMEAFARLLGAPQLRHANGSYDPPPTKATILLYYLAYKGEWCSRNELLYLFYPDTAEEAARSSLRQLLTSIRRLPYSEGLEIEATRLRWQIATDVQAFKQAVSGRQWLKATELYRGDLLEGCTLTGMPELESWFELEREELQETQREATLSFVGQLEESWRYADAAELLGKLYRADPLDETVLRRWVIALYQSSERHKALEVYEAFTRTLRQELDSEPEQVTLQLIERIKRGEPLGVTAADEATSQPVIAKPQRRPLPLQATPFIGRQAEKAKLAQQLSDPACRLLTIVGAGGMGKTRLALEVAVMQEKAFADGVTFVTFASVGSHDLIGPTIADALDFAFFGSDEPKRQLLAHLRDKEMLLVVDNLEHLLAGVGFISEVLEAAPNLKFLATSREPLNLHAEWISDLEGLSYLREAPQSTLSAEVVKQQNIESYDATRLFVQSARKVQEDFTLDETNVPAVMRICQLVEGMPLALELAAGWLRILPLDDVVAEIERGLDLLEGVIQDLPLRHRSLRAVFDHSWHLLSEAERAALRKLSVVRGGFTREAAAQVADVSLPLLLSLSNKSLLKATASKRFERHPLVWQYSKEKADAYPAEQARARDRHCAYYAAFLHKLEGPIHGGDRQKEAFSGIDSEINDIRAAWSWATEQRDVNALSLSLDSLQQFYYVRGLFQEGEEAFSAAAESLGEDSVTLSKLLVAQALFAWEQRHLDAAQAACEQSIAMRERLGAPPDARAYLHLGIVHVIREDFDQAERLHNEGLAVAEASGDLYAVGCNLNMLAQVAAEKADAEKAERYYHKSIAAFRQRRDRWGLRLALTNLGLLLTDLGRTETAEACYQESLQYGREIGNLPGVALTLLELGRLSHLQEDYCQAEAYYLESLAIYRKLENEDAALALVGLGDTAHALHDHSASITYFADALTTTIRHGDRRGAVATVISTADLLLSVGEEGKSLLLLDFALSQQGLEQEAKGRAERRREEVYAQLPEEAIPYAQHHDRVLELEDIQKMIAVCAQRLNQRTGTATS